MSDARDRFQQVVGTAKLAVDSAVVTAATVQGALGPLPDQPVLNESPDHSTHLQVDLASEALARHVEMFAGHADRQLEDRAEELSRRTADRDPWSETPTLVVDPVQTSMATMGVEAADPTAAENEATNSDAEAITESDDVVRGDAAAEADVDGADDGGEGNESTEADAGIDLVTADGRDMDAAHADVEGADASESGAEAGLAG